MMGRFYVSEVDLNLTPHKRCSNRDPLSKTSEISPEKRECSAHVAQETIGLLREGRRFR
jgi:hypothetical protein